MAHRFSLLYALLLPVSTLMPQIPGALGVEIKSLRVPDRVVNGSASSVVLDCDYSLNEPISESGLVVKWFFNDHPDPVYQWIHSQRPQDLGVLKGRLNLDYRASEDDAKAYRALQILNPTTALSGEYKCLVSTFTSEDSETKKMVIYVPERSLIMTVVKPTDDTVTVTCVAEGVFPEPKLTIIAKDKEGLRNAEVQTVAKQDIYDIVATANYSDKELESPTTFECMLKIPEANYQVSKNTVYYPDANSASSFRSSRTVMAFCILLYELLRL